MQRRIVLWTVILASLTLTVKRGLADEAVPSLKCERNSIAAGWSGKDTVACSVAAADSAPREISLACAGAPAGIGCVVAPANVQISQTPAPITVEISYGEAAPFGKFPLQITARDGARSATTEIVFERTANTASAKCPSAEEIDRIHHDLQLHFYSDPTKGTRECSAAAGSRDLTLMQARAYRALSLMRRLSFTEPLPWTRDPLYKWFTKSIRGINFRDDIPNSSCCSPGDLINIRAYVAPRGMGGPMGLGIALTAEQARSMPTDARMLGEFINVIVHEARHNNGKGHTCGSRDKTMKELGSWGTAVNLHVWLADHTDTALFDDTARRFFREMALQMCRRQFCSEGCPLAGFPSAPSRTDGIGPRD